MIRNYTLYNYTLCIITQSNCFCCLNKRQRNKDKYSTQSFFWHYMLLFDTSEPHRDLTVCVRWHCQAGVHEKIKIKKHKQADTDWFRNQQLSSVSVMQISNWQLQQQSGLRCTFQSIQIMATSKWQLQTPAKDAAWVPISYRAYRSMTFHFKSSNVQGSFTAFGKTAPVFFFLEGSCNSYVMYKY